MNDNLNQLQPIISITDLKSNNIIQIPGFLPKAERDKLFDTVCAKQKAFHRISTPGSDIKGALHLSLKPKNSEDSETALIRETCEYLSKCIMKILPKLFTSLGIEPFPVSHIPLSLINGFDGHTSLPHTDDSDGRLKITLLYYFSKIPKAFRGGALEFYETDATRQSGHSDKAVVKIEHEDNLLIAFPSQTYHGVTDVELDSIEFEDGRFVVVGFLGVE